MTCAVVSLLTNLVLNMIVADCNADTAPDGTYLVEIQPGDSVGDGFTYDPETKTFTAPQ